MSISESGSTEFESYDYQIYPKDGEYLPTIEKIEWEMAKTPLSERIQLLRKDSSDFSTYQIDGCIQATVPSDPFREKMVQHWQTILEKWRTQQEEMVKRGEKLAASYKSKGWTFVLLTGIGIIGLMNPAFQAAATVAIAAGVLTSIVYFYKAATTLQETNETKQTDQTQIDYALRQVQGWQMPPAETIAKIRARLYQEGFDFLFLLKQAQGWQMPPAETIAKIRAQIYPKGFEFLFRDCYPLLLPFEVEALYEKHLSQYLSQASSLACVSDRQRVEWLTSFLIKNPLSAERVSFAYTTIPDPLRLASKKFEELKTTVQAIRAHYKQERVNNQNHNKKALDEIEKERKKILNPLETNLQAQINKAKQTMDRKLSDARRLRNQRIGNPGQLVFDIEEEYRARVAEIRDEYEIEVREAKEHFAIAEIPINLIFQEKATEVNKKFEPIFQKLENQEIFDLSPYFDPARHILEIAYRGEAA